MRLSISSSNARFIVIAGAFFCLIFLLDRVIAIALEQIVLRSEFRFSRLYTDDIDTEVIVMGNSRALHSVYAPELKVPNCFETTSLAYNGLSVFAVERLVLELARMSSPPKLVVLEISVLYSDDDADSQLSIYRRRSEELSGYLDELTNSVLNWRALFNLLDFNSEMLYRSLLYIGHSDQSWINSTEGHFVAGTREAKPSERYEYGNERLRSIIRIQNFLDEQEISLVAFVSPYHPSLAAEIENVDSWWSELQEHMVVHEPSSHLNLADEHFSDALHTNIEGARVLNKEIIKLISERIGCG